MSRRSPVVPPGPAALPGVPGSVGVPWLGDRSVEFYRDPVRFVESRIQSHRGRVFSSRVLNTPTVFLCSVQGMKELLCEKSSVFVKDPKDIMTNMYGDTLVTTNGEEACLLRLSLSSLFTGSCLDSWNDYITRVCERCLKDLSVSGHPDSVYSVFKGLGTELVLGLFLNVRSEHQPELYQEMTQLCTQHWHGLISAPVSVKVPLWSSGFCTALEARDRLMDIIRDRLDKDTHGFVGSLGSLPLPGSSCASQHLLLFISALIPKALASLLTSFTLALSGPHMEESRRRAREEPNFLHNILLEVQRLWPPFIGGRRIANQDSSLTGFHVPKGFAAMYISHSVHRDPEVFLQPDHFLPDRWSGRNQGQEHVLCCLGNGPRNCIGTKLNEVFLKAACVYLLKHYNWCLDLPSQDLQYKWLPVCRPSNPPTVSFTKLDHSTPDHNSSSSPDHNSSSTPDHNSSPS